MVDLSVLSTFSPVSPSVTKNSGGDDISDFAKTLKQDIRSDDAHKLAQKIQAEAEKLEDKVKQLELVERSIAYIRAEGGSDLSLKVYENLKDEDKTNGFLDVFGTADKVPDIVKKSDPAQIAWRKIASGAAYDHIKESEVSISQDLDSAREEVGEDGRKILKVANNPALQNLKVQLMEPFIANGMLEKDAEKEADRDITKMLRQAEDSTGRSFLWSGEKVEIELGSPSNTLSASRTRKLEKYRDSLTEERINRAGTPEAAKRILEEKGVIDGFEALRPKGIKPEVFYTEQMQAVLDRSEKYKGYTVAAIPSLEKIKATVGGKEQELITTSNKNVFINSDRQFVVKKNGEYSIIKPKDGEIQVGEAKIAIKDIKPSQPKIRILMDENKNQNKVEDESITATIQYLQDQKSVYGARNDEEAKEAKGTLDREIDLLNESKVALAERRKKEEKEGKSDNNDTLASIMGIIGGIATIVAALSQGGGRNTTITGGGGYNGQGGQNGYGYGSYLASDKYGYNRGYQATVDAAYERSNQYLSTFYNNPVKTRATIMRQNGMAAITGRNGGPGVYGYINATRY
jgi:hypothetical protein